MVVFPGKAKSCVNPMSGNEIVYIQDGSVILDRQGMDSIPGQRKAMVPVRHRSIISWLLLFSNVRSAPDGLGRGGTSYRRIPRE